MNTKKNPTPEGYSTVCPYLMVPDVKKEIDFLQRVFDAEVKEQLPTANGSIGHGEVRIGDCTIMIGRAQAGYPCEAMTYIFVNDAEAIFNKAIQSGAAPVMELGDRFYGYREGGFKDEFGNQWWIAQVIRKVSQEEMERLSKENMKG